MQNEKIAYIQWLRPLAAGAVVLMHTAAVHWLAVPIESSEWLKLTIWDALVRWPVPLFVMITGALFLPRKTELRTVLTRYIPRLAVAWLVWSMIYALYGGVTAEEMLTRFLAGHYHLWYLPFLMGVYLVLPFVQRIAEDGRLTRQLLCVSGTVALLIPWLADAAALIWLETAGHVQAIKNHLNFSFFFDHLSFLLLGHVLHQTELTPKLRRMIYAAGLLGLAVTVVGTVWASNRTGMASSLFFGHGAPNVVCAAAAIFVFAKYNLTRLPKLVDRMAGCSFGVYLCHVLIIEVLADRGIHTLTWDPVWSVPVLAVAVSAAAMTVTALLAKVPVVRNYLT